MNIRSIKQILPLILMLCFLAFYLYWRLSSHPFSDILPINKTSITHLNGNAAIAEKQAEKDTVITKYELQNLSNSTDDFQAFMALLETSTYRSDFRNLLPWKTTYIAAEKDLLVTITLSFGSTETESCSLFFYNNQQVGVQNNSNNSFSIYRLVSNDFLEKLSTYLKENGIVTE